MSGILQIFGFKKSPYLRPTQRWICGNEATGQPCPSGPNRRGQCPGGAECFPSKKGDRWQCTRSSFAGGPCETGPLPDGSCCRPITRCQPQRNISAKRGVLAAWISSVTIALILIGLSLAGGAWLANPGGLSHQHTQTQGCESCHSAFETGVRGWLHSAFTASSESGDSERCLECHDLGETPMLAHSVSADTIEQLTASSQATQAPMPLTMKLGALLFGHAQSDQIVCMTCHREHQGAQFDLNSVTNQTCMSCHATSFKSFSNGHPGFSDYPYQRRTHIAFDHVSHINKHFDDDDYSEFAPKGCNNCHTPDAAGQTMRTDGFDQNCGACHLGQIVGEGRASAKGIFVFGVPGLDREIFYERGIRLGEWPEFSEEPISPFVELLLSSDERFTTAYSAVKELDFMNLDDADDQTLEQIAQIAWSFKALMYDLIGHGAHGLHERLAGAIEQPLDDQMAADLIAMLPMELILSTQHNWFPGLMTEVSQYRRGEEVSNPLIEVETDELSTISLHESTDTEDDLFADEQLDDLLPDSEEDDSLFEADEDDLMSDNLDDELSDVDGLLGDESDPDDLFTADEDDLFADTDEDDLFADTDEDDLFADTDEDGLFADNDEDDLFADNDEDGLFDTSLEQAELSLETDAPIDEASHMSQEEWMTLGGWYRDDLTLRYRPTGHEDKFITRWLEIGSQTKDGLALKVFDQLSAEQAPGGCMKCHSIDQQDIDPSGADQQESSQSMVTINWLSKQAGPLVHTFTKFSHTAHFSLLDQKGCSNCHQLDSESDFMSGFEDRDQMSYSSNFKPMEKSICESCHLKEAAGDDCIACHAYHTGSFEPASPINTGMIPQSVE